MAARAYTRKGISTACSQYSLARVGTIPYAATSTNATHQRSWAMGKMA